MKKCDEQVKIVDEQARGTKMEGKMRADFLDRRIYGRLEITQNIECL
jgi:hypothetical protein